MHKYSIYDIRQHTKANVKIGQFVRIINMAGEPQYTGRTGTVKFIDDAGQIHGTWGGCAIQPDNDIYEVIENTLKMKFFSFYPILVLDSKRVLMSPK